MSPSGTNQPAPGEVRLRQLQWDIRVWQFVLPKTAKYGSVRIRTATAVAVLDQIITCHAFLVLAMLTRHVRPEPNSQIAGGAGTDATASKNYFGE